MADNFTWEESTTGIEFASDDVSGVQYQVVKLADGTVDSATKIAAGEGEKANALRVALPTDAADVKVTLDGETVQLAAGTAAIGKLAANSGVDIGDVDVLSLPNVILGAGTAAFGKLAANSGVDIGDVDVLSLPDVVATGKAAHDSPVSGNPVLLAARAYALAPTAVSADGDVAYLWVDRAGRLMVGTRATGRTPVNYQAAYSASQTGATVYTPGSGKKLCVTHLVISASGAGTVKLFDGTDTAANAWSPILSLAANGGWEGHFSDDNPLVMSAADNLLKYTSGAGAAGSIWLHGWEE